MRILLLSTGGRPLFRHARRELSEFLTGCQRIGFVTAANLFDEAAYFQRAQAFFRTIGKITEHIRWQKPSPRDELASLDAIAVGGGNTFALLDRLWTSGLDREIQQAIQSGTPYIGASAGANIAGPNILTTNDWNVVGGAFFDALEFVPWNINPHYPMTRVEERGGTKFGETRDERIAEFHRVNRNPVVGLEEPAMIRVEDAQATVLGKGRVRLFARHRKPAWFSPGQKLPRVR